MGTFRVALVCTIAVSVAGCALATGTASAMSLAEWQIEGESMKELSLTEESVSASSSGSLELKGVILGASVRLKCTGVGASGKLQQEAKAELTLSWTGCAMVEPAGCKVSEKMSRGLNLQTIEAGEILYAKLAPPSGETLMEVTVSGCALAGTFPLKGTALCEEGEEKTEEELVKLPFTYSEAISKAAGCGTYKLGASAATIAGEIVQSFELQGPRVGKRFRDGRRVLCKSLPQANKACPAGEGYEGEVTGSNQAGTEVELTDGAGGKISCNQSSFQGFYRPGGLGTVTAITFKDNRVGAGKCKSNRMGETETTLTFMKLPTLTSKFEYKPEAGHDGLLYWAKLVAEFPLKVKFANETCIYEATATSGVVINGAGAVASKVGVALNWTRVEAELGNPNLCPANLAEPNTFFTLGRVGGNLYLTKK